ncbi:MAG TPA: DUF4838 domain-containing protein [Chthoniobacteraceae bacterium]|nr:DUF4838 domain-containing protein [Chthoniobacteraceae bacterium]
MVTKGWFQFWSLEGTPLRAGGWLMMALAILMGGCREPAQSNAVCLIRDGAAVSVIVLPKQADPVIREVVEDFLQLAERSTGARIALVEEGEEGAFPADWSRFWVGATSKAGELGLSRDRLPEEGYQLVAHGNTVVLVGRDQSAPMLENRQAARAIPTRWGLNRVLEDGLGIRWLWPGELGTYVPRHRHLYVQVQDTIYQPPLSRRTLRVGLGYARDRNLSKMLLRVEQEAFDWQEAHQAGSRTQSRFGHAFMGWWEKYGSRHPDWFAQPPAGISQPYGGPNLVKLRLSNPAVIERIAAEYEAVGAPVYYNVCPNDGAGFDLSKETQAWDFPKGQSEEAIWGAKADLTARYVEFWNRLYARLAGINPDVILSTYAYSAYRHPPRKGTVHAKLAIGIVSRYEEAETWKQWADAAVEVYLRPNWWHYGAGTPYLPLKEESSFLAMARENRLAGVDMDSVIGHWALQGLNYYLVARMINRPDLSLEEIIDEYTSAFGAGAGKIQAYFDYWQALSAEYAFGFSKGKASELIDQKRIASFAPRGSRHALPILFTPEVMQPAHRLLDEAAQLIGENDPEARSRVEFLRDGLREMEATRDLVAADQALRKAPGAEDLERFREEEAALIRLRRELTPRHVVWGDYVSDGEIRRKIYRYRTMAAPVTEEPEEM